MHCMRFSCAGAVVVFVRRVCCLLPVPDVFLVLRWAGAVVWNCMKGLAVVLCVWVGISSRGRLFGG